MKITQLTEKNIEEFGKKDIWLELAYEIEEGFNSLEEMLNNDTRIRRIYYDDLAIISSKELKSFLNEIPYKPCEIQTLGEANIGNEVFSEDAVNDILMSNEFVEDLIDNKKGDELASIIVERCIELVNNLPLEVIINFDPSYTDELAQKEAGKILLPYYLDYREKLKEEYLRTDKILIEKINKIQNEL